MKKSIATKKSFLVSLGAFATCCAMLVGSTFAWFTDSAESGTNSIVAGNLHINLQYRTDAEGEWNDFNDQDSGLLQPKNKKWEPGQTVYNEFKVENTGNLALKYSLALSDCLLNYVLIPNPDYNAETSADGDENTEYEYLVTQKSLLNKIQIAAYRGTFEDLKQEVQEEDGYTDIEDKDVVKVAIELGLLEFYGLGDQDLFSSVLAPAGKYNSESDDEQGDLEPLSITYSMWDDEDPVMVENVIDNEVFTLIAYWIPGITDEDGYTDDDVNLNNGKKATPLEADDPFDEYYSNEGNKYDPKLQLPYKGEETAEELSIQFNIVALAGQVTYESDSFGNQYDDTAELPDDPFWDPPDIG